MINIFKIFSFPHVYEYTIMSLTIFVPTILLSKTIKNMSKWEIKEKTQKIYSIKKIYETNIRV